MGFDGLFASDLSGFNEAGAHAPRGAAAPTSSASPTACFNEAGAHAPRGAEPGAGYVATGD